MADRTLPIFPLPLVLFPGTPLPLHIFEPRYRQMLADCEAGDGAFGLSYAREGPGGDPEPALGAVGCTALLRRVQRLPDGRANILTVGADRYVLRDWVPSDRLYRVGRVERFDDEPDGEDLHGVAGDVREAFARLAEALATLQDAMPPALALPEEPAALSFHVAAALDLPPEAKQELLALRSAARRLLLLREILDRLNHEAARRVEVHSRAKRNGKAGSTVGPGP